MSERTLKQLVGALAVVVGLWVVASLFSGGGGGAIGASISMISGGWSSSARAVATAGENSRSVISTLASPCSRMNAIAAASRR